MELRAERAAGSKRKREIQAIYTDAFRKEDRMPFPMMLALSCLWHTDFLAFYDGDTLCGFVYLASLCRLSFIMFFAVGQGLRCKGYGSRILEQVRRLHPKNRIVVSIEPCGGEGGDSGERLRRKRFYLRNGFKETGYFLKLGKVQEILVQNGAFDKRAFRIFFMLYSNFTMYPRIWRPSGKSGETT